MIFGRGRLAKVIDSQIDLFVLDHRHVLDEAADRFEAYNRASKEEAEELYGDYLDAVETGTQILADMRDAYAQTLDDPERYLRAFDKAVRRRLPPFALEIENR